MNNNPQSMFPPRLAMDSEDSGERRRRFLRRHRPPSGRVVTVSSSSQHDNDDSGAVDSVQQPLDFSNKCRRQDRESVGDEKALLCSSTVASCPPSALNRTNNLLLPPGAVVCDEAAHWQPVHLFPSSPPPFFPATATALFAGASPLPLLGLLMRQVAMITAATATNGMGPTAAAFPAGLAMPQLTSLPFASPDILSSNRHPTAESRVGGGGGGDGDIIVSSSSDEQPDATPKDQPGEEQQQEYHRFRQQVLQQLSQQQQQQLVLLSSSPTTTTSTTLLDPKGLAYMERRAGGARALLNMLTL
jgi:hypothetical protein